MSPSLSISTSLSYLPVFFPQLHTLPQLVPSSLGSLCLSVAIQWTHIIHKFDVHDFNYIHLAGRKQEIGFFVYVISLLLFFKLDFDLNWPRTEGSLYKHKIKYKTLVLTLDSPDAQDYPMIVDDFKDQLIFF